MHPSIPKSPEKPSVLHSSMKFASHFVQTPIQSHSLQPQKHCGSADSDYNDLPVLTTLSADGSVLAGIDQAYNKRPPTPLPSRSRSCLYPAEKTKFASTSLKFASRLRLNWKVEGDSWFSSKRRARKELEGSGRTSVTFPTVRRTRNEPGEAGSRRWTRDESSISCCSPLKIFKKLSIFVS